MTDFLHRIAMGIEQELQVMVKQPDVLYDDIDHRFGLYAKSLHSL